MLDQSFSSSNLIILFLRENRKGNFNKSYFTPEYTAKHQEFKSLVREKILLKKEKAKLSKEELDDFAKRLEIINNEKEEIRISIFEDLSKAINLNTFKFNIEYNNKKEVYTVENDAASYYAIKQLQTNISKTFKVIQADRNRIIKQLFNILSDGFPKVVIKTDIKSFYESIPQDKLFDKIEDNTLLSPFSKKLLRKLFYEFEDKKDKTIIEPQKGIPRGIGLSAYLSELYMRDIDNSIKSLQDVIYYARYVDDIIIIFSPKTTSTKGKYLEEIKKIICNNNSLSLKDGTDGKENKTFEIDLMSRVSYNESFNFLGYLFQIKRAETMVLGKKKVDFQVLLEISDNKIERYKKRLKLLVDAYNQDSIYNEKEARNMLYARLKFLTGNFHLNNNKRNVKSGIYYSNEMLKLNTITYESLKRLDKERMKAVKSLQPPPKIGIKKTNIILHILNNFSFQKGFNQKEKYFYSFTFGDRENKFYSKKFKRSTNKFEVIKSIWKDE
ncbi:hypothetical protein GCM10011514_53400 [Emticicia aquatilis]|uniref:Reverse transcriptase domain-containing protein n=1 Tax=Emticicia aquatilis TaxID=1537369 RepID=A0A916ZAN5_9BACT|nr:antiviral reverse transcriptase Drt3a [Emticicia aquatilis]GGD82649.1 hypothetical protein GCM10011514_53400 [Emticicia aquatilis]